MCAFLVGKMSKPRSQMYLWLCLLEFGLEIWKNARWVKKKSENEIFIQFQNRIVNVFGL